MRNFDLNHIELCESRYILESYPRTLFVELTRNCNMYCTCCRPEILADKTLNMSDEILQKIEETLFPSAQVIDFRGWGESTLDNRLLDLIRRWMNKDKELFIYSNCQTRDTAYWNSIFECNLNVAISLRSADKNKYESYMRGASYHRLISHLEMIPRDNKVLFTMVVDDENIDDIEGVVELAERYNIKRIHLNPLVQRKFKEDYPTFGVLPYKREYLLKKLKYIDQISKKKNIKIQICSDLLDEGTHNLGKCIHPWSYVYIAYNGDIGFCDHLMCVDDAIMGNIEEGFDKVWNNNKYQQLRKMHDSNELNQVFGDKIECKWCYKNRYANWEGILESDKQALDLSNYLDMKME